MNSPARILVTRSGAEGRALSDRLSAWHFSPVELRGPSDPDAVRQRLLSLLPADCLVVPSAEALRQLPALLDLDRIARTPIVVPGRGTARVASALGLENVLAPSREGTSERMLDLPALQAVQGRRILVLAASGGRRLIEQTLRDRGAQVHRVHVYRRLPAHPGADLLEALASSDELVTLLASGGALAGLQRHFPPPAWRAVMTGLVIAPSHRVADLARAAGCRQVVSAAGADDVSMLAAFVRARPDLLPMGYSVEIEGQGEPWNRLSRTKP